MKTESTFFDYNFDTKQKVQKGIVWISIVGIIMLFAGFTSAYIVSMAEGEWLYFDLPTSFVYSTTVIILSSISLFLSWFFVGKNNQQLSSIMLGITLIFAFLFVYFQFEAWKTLVNQGIYFAGKESSRSGSYLYVLSGLHLVHLFGGIIGLLVTFFKSLRKMYSPENKLGIELCSIYWHFLGGLWIYLYLFLNFIR
jgi:cytochrome c oxidase subunit III